MITVTVLLCAMLGGPSVSHHASSQTTRTVRHYRLDVTHNIENLFPTTATFGMYFDNTVSASYESEVGAKSMTVTGTPERFGVPKFLTGPFDRTTLGYGWFFDQSTGGDECLEFNDHADFDPAGDWSALIVFQIRETGHNVDTQVPMSKYKGAANQYSWMIWLNYDDVRVNISDTGNNWTDECRFEDQISNENDQIHVLTVAYNYVADLTSEMYVFLDDDITSYTSMVNCTWNTLNGPVDDGAADFRISGSNNNCNTELEGILYYVYWWNGTALTSANHLDIYHALTGSSNTSGEYQIKMTATTPPKIAMDPGNADHALMYYPQGDHPWVLSADGASEGGIYAAGALTNICEHGDIAEACTAGNANNWLSSEVGGSNHQCSYDKGTAIRGSRFESYWIDGDASETENYIRSDCEYIDQDLDQIASVWVYAEDDCDEDFKINFYCYTGVSCTSGGGIPTHSVGNIEDNVSPQSQWVQKYAVVTDSTLVAGGYNSCYLYIRSQAPSVDDCDFYVDAIQWIEIEGDEFRTPAFCPNRTTSDVTCTLLDYYIDDHPLTGTETWSLTMTVNSPTDWAFGTDRVILGADGTSGNSNKIKAKIASDTITFSVWDNAGPTEKQATVSCAKDADTDVDLAFHKTSGGAIWVCCDGTCGTRTTGAVTTDINSTLHIGGDGATAGDIWIRDFKIKRGT